ncbi:MAG: FHA domain-containing protein [Myxococcota bacterium]
MSNYRLRYQSTDLEMPVGDFVIGRSSSCHLALDDALVSRRHAVFHVAEDGVTVEDMGSRNGITLNGRRVEGQQPVSHLDRVTIGSQELILIEIGKRNQGNRPTREYALCEKCGSPVDPDHGRCSSCGAAVSGKSVAGATLEMQVPVGNPSEPAGGGGTGGGFHLIAGIADKALAMNRFAEVERMLATHLDGMLEQARNGGHIPDEQLQQATHFALRLAEGLSQPRWIDWTFRIHQATGNLMAAATIDRLYELVRKARYDDARPLRAYLDIVRGKAGSFSAAERFLLKRLEGLERVISA